MLCERCGGLMSSGIVELCGGWFADVCAACRNEWDAYIREQPSLFERLMQLRTREAYYNARAIAHQPPGEADLYALAQEIEALNAQIKALSRAWVAQRIVRPTKA